MDLDYISRAKTQETEREIAQIQLVSAAKRAQHRAGAVPKPRTVSSRALESAAPCRTPPEAGTRVEALRSAS